MAPQQALGLMALLCVCLGYAVAIPVGAAL